MKGDSRLIGGSKLKMWWPKPGGQQKVSKLQSCSKHERACNSSQPDKWRQQAYEAATPNLTS